MQLAWQKIWICTDRSTVDPVYININELDWNLDCMVHSCLKSGQVIILSFPLFQAGNVYLVWYSDTTTLILISPQKVSTTFVVMSLRTRKRNEDSTTVVMEIYCTSLCWMISSFVFNSYKGFSCRDGGFKPLRNITAFSNSKINLFYYYHSYIWRLLEPIQKPRAKNTH